MTEIAIHHAGAIDTTPADSTAAIIDALRRIGTDEATIYLPELLRTAHISETRDISAR